MESEGVWGSVGQCVGNIEKLLLYSLVEVKDTNLWLWFTWLFNRRIILTAGIVVLN